MTDPQFYHCYLISSEKKKRTYIGITNNLPRRLKQHNGKIKGGAKSTRSGKGSWVYHTIVGEFANKSDASKFEWYWKHIRSINGNWRRNSSGIENKIKRLIELLVSDEWKDKSIVLYEGKAEDSIFAKKQPQPIANK